MEIFRITRLRGIPPVKSVLEDIRSRCKSIPELEPLCLQVVDRLEILHDTVAEMVESNRLRVKYVDVVLDFFKIVRRKPLLVRLARFNTTALLIRELHQKLDGIENGDATKWEETWETTWTEQFSTLEKLVLDATDRQLVRELKSEKMVEEVLLELNKELGKDITDKQRELMQTTLDWVLEFTQLHVQFADWFISANDLTFEGGPVEAGTFGEVRQATWFHDGERTHVVVKELFPQTTTTASHEVFEELERWSKLRNSEHILKLYGGSHVSEPNFFVSEYAPYGNLRDFDEQEKPKFVLVDVFASRRGTSVSPQ